MALDILILAVVVVAGILGYRRGILTQVGAIIGILAGIVVARMYGPRLAAFFAGAEAPTMVETASAYIVAFILTYLVVWLLARLLRTMVSTVKMGVVDRLIGAVFKIAQWLLVLSLALNLYIMIFGPQPQFDDPAKPWRAMTVDFAPALLGYVTDVASNKL